MEAKALIEALKKLKPETEIVLWEYKGVSVFHDLQPTANPARYKGFYLLLVNKGYIPEPKEIR